MSYIYAQKNGYDFSVAAENWQYGNEWHDCFTSLKKYDPSVKYDKEEKISHGTKFEKYTLREYNKAIAEIFLPVPEISARAEAFKGTIGGPYVCLQIRRGDKTSGAEKEMDPVDIPKLIGEVGIKDGNVFVMTDDYSVVEEITKLLPACKIFTMTEPGSRGASAHAIRAYTPEEKKKHASELIASIEVFNGGEKGWSDTRSNLGRLLKIRGLDKVILYPTDDSTRNIPLNTIVDPPNKSLSK